MHRSYPGYSRFFLVLCVLCVGMLPLTAALTGNHRFTTIYLVLDGVNCGRITEFSGGAIAADPVEQKGIDGQVIKKQLGPFRYEAIRIKMLAPLPAAVQTWIANTWELKAPQRSGSILFTAEGGGGTSLQFTNALLIEVAFPAIDAGEDNAGEITLTFLPATLTEGAVAGVPAPPATTTKEKGWSVSAFRLALDGMNCTRVTHIESFAVQQGTTGTTTGVKHDFIPKPGKMIYPNLRLTLPNDQAATWRQWLLMSANAGDTQEKTGTLTLLTPDLKTEIHRIDLINVGICRVERELHEASGVDNVPGVIVELYCEQMKFNASNAPAPVVKPEGAQVPNGKGEFKKAYSMRQSEPLNFSLQSANYTVNPVSIGEDCFTAAAGEKLLVLHFTIENPHATERMVRGDSLRVSAIGVGQMKFPAKNVWGIETTNEPTPLDLQPGKKVSLFAVITVPAKGEPTTILVKSNRENDGPDLSYDLHGQAPALPAPFADPADATGATALEEVPAKTDTSYPCDFFAVTLEKMAYTTTTPLGEVVLNTGERFLVCTLLMKNHTPVEHLLRWDMLRPLLTTKEKEKMDYKGMLLETTDRHVKQPIRPGDEIRVRIFFTVLKDAVPKQLMLQENKSRRYLYPVP